ncbi:divalent-cation tolerance protein CutA [Stappia sp.]|uniref:divalent-cation tolerance protein CutA n=1 Tax=Stappia sp. TaxID=1870903 RepID=UPI003A99FC2D
MDIRLIYATFPDMAAARAAAGPLVRDGLAACVNMWPGMISVYCWEGAVEDGEEVVFLAKTTAARQDEVVEAIRALHPYDEPAILVLPVEGGSPSFLDWIRAGSRGPDTGTA